VDTIIGTHANQALPLSPSPTVLTNISIVLAIAGDSKGTESALSLRKEEEKASKPSSTHFIIGMQALQAGQTQKAMSELELSHEFSEEDVDVSYWLADTYSKVGHCEAAVPMFTSILRRKGDVLLDYSPLIWPLSNYGLAVCYEKLGKSQDSRNYYAKLLELWRNGDADNQVLTRAREAYNRK